MKVLSGSRARAGILAGSLLLLLASGACSPSRDRVNATSAAPPASLIVPSTQGPVPETGLATAAATSALSTDSAPGWKTYSHPGLGLSFRFPAEWYGPDIYEWGQGVRLEVGSDKVYPYGTNSADQVLTVKDSYYVVIQYSLNANNLSVEQFRRDQPWVNVYYLLLGLQDGQSLTGTREVVTRIRSFKLGKFEGLEYVSTLPATAQTDLTYIRQTVLLDEHLNALTVMGTPNNVTLTDKAQWQEAYRRVDQANEDVYHKVLDSISVQ